MATSKKHGWPSWPPKLLVFLISEQLVDWQHAMRNNNFIKVIARGALVGIAGFSFVTLCSTWYLFSLHRSNFEVSFLNGTGLIASIMIAPWLENTLVVLIVISINALVSIPKLIIRFFTRRALQFDFLEIGTFPMFISGFIIYTAVLGTHVFPSAYFNGVYFIVMQWIIFHGSPRKLSFEGFATSVVSHFTSNCLFMLLGHHTIVLLKSVFQTLT
ncbi:MAG TPA: hypothetical protein DIU09_09915 [Hyphomonadaceae bacterium]|nr:hypothetical protein [Hyphomonadaceae bacterium]